jgi:ferredoxin
MLEPAQKGKNILSVVRSKLCTGCGTCLGVCPTSAITMEKNDIYVPKIQNAEVNLDAIFVLKCVLDIRLNCRD